MVKAEETGPGRVIGGRYRLVGTLDFGGMGRVWRAHDETLRLDVAVKEVWLSPAMPAHEREERLARAEREARNAAALRDHPHVVAVHDVVVEDGVPWIVMRLVTGQSLEKRLADGPLPAEDAVRVAGQLLDALEAAHGAGIVHRDVKPANVLLAEDGTALLADFGIAVHHADTTITGTGTLIGSVEYMAPERLNGEDGLAESDLYSLGVTLYQAVEGLSPFRRGTPTATLTAVLLEDAPAPEHAGALATLITRLLDKDPGRRPDLTEARALLTASSTKKLDDPAERTGKLDRTAKETKKFEEITEPPKPPKPPERPGGPAKGVSAGRTAGVVAVLVVVGLVTLLVTRGAVGHLASQLFDRSSATSSATATPSTTERSTPRTTPTRTTPTRTRATTPSARPADLDREAGDTTPLTTSALLADSFTDDKNVHYTRKSAGVRDCVTQYLSQRVRDLLRRSGCDKAVGATYVDDSGRILAMVWVVPMKDEQTAKTAYEAYDSGSWGVMCPGKGPGAEICDEDKDTSRATRSGYTRRTHRYLIESNALYINLTTASSAKPALTAAASAAADSAGPLNHPGNR
ncbi:serine/threonine-protein kinase [Amycolatopsis samaneae]|uniref:non-specific serine/threonine protein kinase n=1 Tax=Amycolatopsis samaneae TaxID=664691 RepID=A0ABW5GCK2_9PSEU